MFNTKETTLKPLLESANGLHLTAYVVNRGDVEDLKTQLREILTESNEWLQPVMASDQSRKFLAPVETLMNDDGLLLQMKGNIGLFRNQQSFRILNIPIPVEPMCQVATSFHVKPLLKWLQSDREFLLLGIEPGSAHLYWGTQNSFHQIETIVFPEPFIERKSLGQYMSLKESKKRRLREEQNFAWINQWISDVTRAMSPKLFIAGEKQFVTGLSRGLKYPQTVRAPVMNRFGQHLAGEACTLVRDLMKGEAKSSLEKALFEFRLASEDGRVQKNIFQISKAVVQGRVRKLLVAEELNVFGKVDRNSGGLAIHPCDLDHEDDDILDDLAQMVLNQGGEVVIASRDQIPKGRPILAILEKSETEKEKSSASEYFEILHERSG